MTSSRSAILAVLGAAALLLGSCGSGDGDGSGDTTTTAAAAATTSTTAAPTTTAPEATSTIDALFPAPAAVGDGYEPIENPAPNATDRSFAAGCPAASHFGYDPSDASMVSRTYDAPDGRRIQVGIDPDPKYADAAAVDAAVAAINACDPVETGTADASLTIAPSAERFDEFGPGLRFVLDITYDGPAGRMELAYRGVSFLAGDHGVDILVQDGFDAASFEAVPGDTDAVERLGRALATRVGAA